MTTETYRLSVTGMTCAGCAGRVERALAGASGVEAAHVNLANAIATIRANEATLPQLIKVVSDTGYAAEESVPSAPRVQSDEAGALLRSFILAAALTLPVFLVEMGGHAFPPLHHWIMRTVGMQMSWSAQFVLITAVLLFPGWRFFKVGVPNLLRGAPEMNSLVALGAGAAWLYSTVVTFAPDLLPADARHVYFESAGVIVTLILLGRFLEARAKRRARDAVSGLIALQPESALVEVGESVQERDLADLLVGDVLHLRAGERVAVDGTVVSGTSYVDEAMLSGEPLPVAKAEGDVIHAGTINGDGLLRYRAQAVGAQTALARIVAQVEEAQGMKLPVQSLADRVIRLFVPVVIVIALCALVAWLLAGQTLSFALVITVSVLIIACPCALGLAVPVSVMVGSGRAASKGVLFRQGDALQHMEAVKVIAFDKTGTLTEGRFDVSDVVTFGDMTRERVLALAAGAESGSDHPIAQAIAAHGMGLDVDDAKALPGFGVRAGVDGRTVVLGNARLMADQKVDFEVSDFGGAGQTLVFVAVDGAAAGIIALSDQVKDDAKTTVAALKEKGYAVALISGDRAEAVEAVAGSLGIEHVTAGVLPSGKTDALDALKQRFGPVAFVGDGLNDAPALAKADVGIAIGSGTDVAIDCADVVLSSGAPSGVVQALGTSRAVMRNIRQNLFWAFGYNILLIPIAAGLLYPATGLLLSPMLAAGAMALSSVFVVMNALRLKP